MVCSMLRGKCTKKAQRKCMKAFKNCVVSWSPKLHTPLSKHSSTTDTYSLPLDLRFESQRGYFIRLPTIELEDKILPPIFISVNKKKKYTEFSTLELMQWNKRVIRSI